MSTARKLGFGFIGILTAIFSVLTGFLMGNLNFLPLAVGVLPLVLGRIFFGSSVLDYLEEIYSVSIVLQAFAHLSAGLHPEVYLNFFSRLAPVAGSTDGSIIGNLNAIPVYEAVLGSVFVLTVAYSYRERYLQKSVKIFYRS